MASTICTCESNRFEGRERRRAGEGDSVRGKEGRRGREAEQGRKRELGYLSPINISGHLHGEIPSRSVPIECAIYIWFLSIDRAARC